MPPAATASRLSPLAALAALAACGGPVFVQTEPGFRPAPAAAPPRVYLDRLPAEPLAPVGIIELETAPGLGLDTIVALAQQRGQELGCQALIERSIYPVAVDGAPPAGAGGEGGDPERPPLGPDQAVEPDVDAGSDGPAALVQPQAAAMFAPPAGGSRAAPLPATSTPAGPLATAPPRARAVDCPAATARPAPYLLRPALLGYPIGTGRFAGYPHAGLWVAYPLPPPETHHFICLVRPGR